MADRRGRVTAQAGIQLARSLEPGDYLLAGTFGQSGRVPRWERPLAYLAIVLWALGLSWFVASLVAGELLPGGVTAGMALPCLLASAPSARRKPTYMAVTTRYVYLVRMTWTGRTAVRIVAADADPVDSPDRGVDRAVSAGRPIRGTRLPAQGPAVRHCRCLVPRAGHHAGMAPRIRCGHRRRSADQHKPGCPAVNPPKSMFVAVSRPSVVVALRAAFRRGPGYVLTRTAAQPNRD